MGSERLTVKRARRFDNGSGFARLSNDTTWPLPDPRNDDDPSLGWQLRYGKPSSSDLLCAASVIDAYDALIRLPERLRNEVVRAIREANATATLAATSTEAAVEQKGPVEG